MASGKRKTTEEFIQEATLIHGDTYNYSLVTYINIRTKVTIICPTHGQIEIRPNDHLTKRAGCKFCAGRAKKSTDQFINEANAIHGDKYDYSSVDYQQTHTKVTIICPTHGDFEISPVAHLSQKQGCKQCGYEANSKLFRKTIDRFITDAQKIHGDKYDYSLVKYIRNNIKVNIICPKHEVFSQTPTAHVNAKQGCPECWEERRPPGCGGYSATWFKNNPKRKSDNALLYVIEMIGCSDATANEHFIKIGITTKSIKQRFARTNAGDKHLTKNVLHAIPLPLYQAHQLEQNMLSELTEHRYFPNFAFDGMTECVKTDSVVLSIIDDIVVNTSQ